MCKNEKKSKRKFSLVSSWTVATTDWDICFLYQQNSRKKLICSSKIIQKDKYVGYKALVEDLLQFECNGLLEHSLNRLVEKKTLSWRLLFQNKLLFTRHVVIAMITTIYNAN